MLGSALVPLMFGGTIWGHDIPAPGVVIPMANCNLMFIEKEKVLQTDFGDERRS
jgi:hypothetical protein